MRERERERVRTAHRVSDQDDAPQRERVEDRKRVGDEVRGRVRGRGLRRLTVPARVRRDQAQPPIDRAREEVPLPPGMADPVEEERRGTIARVIDAAAREGRLVGSGLPVDTW